MNNKWIWIAVIAGVALLGLAYIGSKSQQTAPGQPTATATPTSAALTGSPTVSPTGASSITVRTLPKVGAYLAAGNGMTLYSFDKDTAGISTCYGNCAVVWPPYVASGSTPTLPENVTLVKRTDGSMQYAFKGRPLYFYQNDKQPGDILGDGFNGVWHLVKP